MSKVLVFSKEDDERSQPAVDRFLSWLKKNSIEVLDARGVETKLTEKHLEGCDCGVVFGGDGTFLTLVRLMEKKGNCPLVGVNLGTLGFITEVNEDEVNDVVQKVLSGNFEEEKRMLLDVSLKREGTPIAEGRVFNDAFVTKDAQTSLLTFEVDVGGHHLAQVRADGYIVATPTGSTGYALSAGAPIIHPSAKAYVTIPICAHTLYSRPLMLPETEKVTVTMTRFTGKTYLCFDGQVSVELKVGDQIVIQRADTDLRLVSSPTKRWHDVLREKLNMGEGCVTRKS